MNVLLPWMSMASPWCISHSIMAVASALTAVRLRAAAWPPLRRLKLAATNVLLPHRSLADYFWCAGNGNGEVGDYPAGLLRAFKPMEQQFLIAAFPILWRF
ncbi:MAG: hypothetical protein ACK5ES_08230 [Planctomyces sp.]|jgi:hypothetical protein